MRRYAAVLAAVAGLALGGCGDATTASPGSPSASPGSPSASPTPQQEDTLIRPDEPKRTLPATPQPSTPPPRRAGEGAAQGPVRDTVRDAVRDLARRLDVDPSAVTVVSAEEVTWRDGSIGCPRPGMMYPQVLTNGTRVVLEAEGERYQYHAGGRRSAFLCENPEPPARP